MSPIFSSGAPTTAARGTSQMRMYQQTCNDYGVDGEYSNKRLEIMKILIIGNGFDLAHGLPTKYTDFLSRTQEFLRCHSNCIDNDLETTNDLLQALRPNNMEEEFAQRTQNNAWLKYFINKHQNNGLKEAKWIDFEREIQNVISGFEKEYIETSTKNNKPSITICPSQTNLHCFINTFNSFRGFPENVVSKNNETISIVESLVEEFIEFLFQELRNLTRAFEIYCDSFINQITEAHAEKHDLKNLAAQIYELQEKISALRSARDAKFELYEKEKNWGVTNLLWDNMEEKEKHDSKVLLLEEDYDKTNKDYHKAMKDQADARKKYSPYLTLQKHDFNFVLSFNYTNTFETLYRTPKIGFCYIHGKAQLNSSKTDMILGIDEALKTEEENSVLAFVKFKKYFQRIFYQTGSEYMDWINFILDSQQDSSAKHEICIVGHSLGASDHEVFRYFFNTLQQAKNNKSKVQISIFYHDERSKIDLIKRMIEIIGRDKLTECVYGSNRTIRFVDQYDEKDGIFKPPGAEPTREIEDWWWTATDSKIPAESEEIKDWLAEPRRGIDSTEPRGFIWGLSSSSPAGGARGGVSTSSNQPKPPPSLK